MPGASAKSLQKSVNDRPMVGVIMGSRSDWPTMEKATEILDELGVPFETSVVSAHRTPERLFKYSSNAKARGIKVLIAGAGGAAHLPGMAASMTTLPVIGVPVKSATLNGVDSLLSIVQMPKGVPVATMSIGEAGAANAGILAASIVALSSDEVEKALARWREAQTEGVPLTVSDA